MPAEAVEGSTTQKPPAYKPWIKGWRRANLVRDLASGEFTYPELGDKYDRHPDTIRDFADRNRWEIQQVKENFADRLSQHWIADKFNRIAESLQDYEECLSQIERLEAEAAETPSLSNDGKPTTANVYWLQLRQHLAKLRREVADEMGQLPTRAAPVPADQGKATYEIVGVDLSEVIKSWEQSPGVPK